MYEGRSIMAMAPVFNEERKIGSVLERVPGDIVDEMVVVDDGSTDGSAELARSRGATVISMGATVGVGAALRRGFQHAVAQGHDIVVVMAGNNKDAPEEIPRLLGPIASGDADLVQGSRWLSANRDFGPMPVYRKLATRLHPRLFSAVAGHHFTDSTNGFRAVSAKVLSDPGLHLDQTWLDQYELEPYLLYKAVKLGYRVTEVPVTKVYPAKTLGQTKMKPITGWWSILRPIVLLGLRLKR